MQKNSMNILNSIDEFTTKKNNIQNITRNIFETKDFQQFNTMKIRFHLLDERLEKNKNITKYNNNDIKKKEFQVQYYNYQNCLLNISKYKWFPICFTRLLDASKRRKKPIVLSCLKFLTVIKCIYMYSFNLNKEIFYYVG